MKAGVALNPHTNIAVLEDTIQDIDLVLIMSVNPGFGGQRFIENTYSKVEKLKDLILQKNASTIIEIDGGVTNNNAKKLAEAGRRCISCRKLYIPFRKPNHYNKRLSTTSKVVLIYN